MLKRNVKAGEEEEYPPVYELSKTNGHKILNYYIFEDSKSERTGSTGSIEKQIGRVH